MAQAFQHLSSGGDYEIQTCLTCSLPDCKPTSKDCPLRAEEAEMKKNMYLFIQRHSPVEESKIRDHFRLDTQRTKRMLMLLRKSSVIKNNEEGLIEIKKKDLSI